MDTFMNNVQKKLRDPVHAIGFFNGSDRSYEIACDELAMCEAVLGQGTLPHEASLKIELLFSFHLEHSNLPISLAAIYTIISNMEFGWTNIEQVRENGGHDNTLAFVMRSAFPEYVDYFEKDHEDSLAKNGFGPYSFNDYRDWFMMASGHLLVQRFMAGSPS